MRRVGGHPSGVWSSAGPYWARFMCDDCDRRCCRVVRTIHRVVEVDNQHERMALEQLGGVPEGGLQYLACDRCDIIYMEPALAAKGQAKFFDGMYRGGVGSTTTSGVQHSERMRLERIARFLRPPGRLLDIGCGTGTFAEAATAEGWEAWGYDISPEGYEAAKVRLQGRALTGSLGGVPTDWADCVTLFSVIEHTTDPVEVLVHAARICRPGGWVIFNVPNARSLEGLVSKALRLPWLGFNVSHVWYWTDRSVRALARQACLTPKTVESRLPSFALNSDRGCEQAFVRSSPPVTPRRRLQRWADPALWSRLRILLNAPFDATVLGEYFRFGSYLFVYARCDDASSASVTP